MWYNSDYEEVIDDATKPKFIIMNISYDLIHKDKLPIFDGVLWHEHIYEYQLETVLSSDGIGSQRKAIFKDKLENVDSKLPAVLYTSYELLYDDGMLLECGEGSWGGIGFICLSTASRYIQFLACFENSNPFVIAEYINGRVRAMNNIGEIWVFEYEGHQHPSIKISMDNPTNLDYQWKNRDSL